MYLYLRKIINGWSYVLDKCVIGEYNCYRLVDCKLIIEGFICICKKGYEGDGVIFCIGVYWLFVYVIKICILLYMLKIDILFLNRFK